jgi:hypothetical protein
MFKKKFIASVVATLLSTATMAQNVILVNEYVKAGVNATTGTLGSGGNTSPGLLYDSTGTGTFNTSYDYLTPGSPFEGWAVRIVNGGVGTNYHNNNAYVTQVPGGAWVGTPTSSSAVWAVNHSNFDLQHTYALGSGKQYLDIATRIEAKIAMDQLYFARFIDPDARAATGDSSSTDNVRGYGVIPRQNVVFSEALTSRYALGLYTTQATGSNTSISPMWSSNPQDYYDNTSGHDVVRGDYTIGISFLSSSLAIGDIVTYRYAYIFGPSAFASASTAIDGGAGGGTAGTSSFSGTLTDIGSATSAASAPASPTITGTSVTNEVLVSTAVDSSLPVITGSLAHHEASKSSGLQTIARTTTTNVTTPWIRTTATTPITTTSYSDSTTTTTRGSTTTTTELFNVVDTSVANDSFSGRADQAEQFDIIKTGLYRNLNRQNARNGVADDKGRIAINVTGTKFNGQNGYSANTSVVGLSYETDIDKNLIVGGQINKINGKLTGLDTTGASLDGYHFGAFADYNSEEGITVQNDVGHTNIKNNYSRTIGPFSNSYSNASQSTWLSTKVLSPEVYGFRPFVGATILNNSTPTKVEAGSIQSAQTIIGNSNTQTIGEYGVQYSADVLGGKVLTEVAKTSNGITEANLILSKADGDVTYYVYAGKSWLNSTTSNTLGLNVKVKF